MNAPGDESYSDVVPVKDTDIVEVINYDETRIEDTGFAETIEIDGEESTEEDNALHPKRKVPKTPVSEDSGTLF